MSPHLCNINAFGHDFVWVSFVGWWIAAGEDDIGPLPAECQRSFATNAIVGTRDYDPFPSEVDFRDTSCRTVRAFTILGHDPAEGWFLDAEGRIIRDRVDISGGHVVCRKNRFGYGKGFMGQRVIWRRLLQPRFLGQRALQVYTSLNMFPLEMHMIAQELCSSVDGFI